MSAVAERSPVAVKPKARVFLARRQELRLVMEKGYEKKDVQGQVYETVQGKHLAFVDGKLVVPASGEMRGEHGETLDAGQVLAFLMGDPENGRLAHPHFGDKFDGFWLHEEPAPAPSAAEHDALAEMAMDLDVDGINRFIEAEEAGWARPELVDAARSQLARATAKRLQQDERVEQARREGAEAAVKAAGSKPVVKREG